MEGDNVLELNPYPQAIAEVVSYFSELDGAIGIRSPGFEGGGRTVFDEDASRSLHYAKWEPGYRRAVQQRTMIGYTLGSIPLQDQKNLELACSARRWDWMDVRKEQNKREKGHKEDNGPSAYEHTLRKTFQWGRAAVSDERSYGVCLLGIALQSPVLKAAFLATPEGKAAPPGEPGCEKYGDPRLITTPHCLLVSREYTWPTEAALFRYLQMTATKRVIEEAKRAAGAVFVQSLRLYDAVMQQRNLALAEARREKTMQRVREQQRVTIKLSHVDYDAITG
jgi:hypothetical protein